MHLGKFPAKIDHVATTSSILPSICQTCALAGGFLCYLMFVYLCGVRVKTDTQIGTCSTALTKRVGSRLSINFVAASEDQWI